MVKVTGPEINITPTTRSGRSSRSAAKDLPGLPITFDTPRTRQKTRAAAAVHAAAVAAVAAATNNGDIVDTSLKSESGGQDSSGTQDHHSYAKSPAETEGIKIESGIESNVELIDDSIGGAQIGVENGSKLNINQLNGDQLKTVKDNAVKIEISVSDEHDGGVTMPTTVANTDVTKPLIINTKFSASPGPSSESTDTASEVSACHLLCIAIFAGRHYTG